MDMNAFWRELKTAEARIFLMSILKTVKQYDDEQTAMRRKLDDLQGLYERSVDDRARLMKENSDLRAEFKSYLSENPDFLEVRKKNVL